MDWQQPDLWSDLDPSSDIPVAVDQVELSTASLAEEPETASLAAGETAHSSRSIVALADLPPATSWARAVAGVVDENAIWLPTGEGVAWPSAQDIPGLLAIAEALPLRCSARSPMLPADGELVLLPGALRRLRWPVRLVEKGVDHEVSRTLIEASYYDIAASPAMADLAEHGWTTPDPGPWMTFRRTQDGGQRFRQIHVSVPSWAERAGHGAAGTETHLTMALGLLDESAGDGIEGLIDPAGYARRLQLFADEVGYPWRVSHGYTGRAFIDHSRRRGRDAKNPPHRETELLQVDEDIAREWVRSDGHLNWNRALLADEKDRRYLHGYDLNAAYLAAAGSLELGYGQPTYLADVEFNPKMIGMWRVETPVDDEAAATWTLPNLLTFDSTSRKTSRWRSTAALAFARQQGYDINVIEAWVWPQKGRYLDQWAERINQARQRLAADGSDDARAVLAALKLVYATAHGRLAGTADRGRTPLYRPDWSAAWKATARSNLLRKAIQAGETSGMWPIAIQTDALVYASDNPDAAAALPAPLKLDPIALGAFKLIGTIDMSTGAELVGTDGLWNALKGLETAPRSPRAEPAATAASGGDLAAYGDYSDDDYWEE